MAYKSLQKCISYLDNKGELKRIIKESDPDLEMASIHLDEFAKNGKTLIYFKSLTFVPTWSALGAVAFAIPKKNSGVMR